MRSLIHYFLHFGAPLLIAVFLFKEQWKKVYLIFLASMLIDLDHLLATPIFQSDRCSINFHPLHSYLAIGVYLLGLFLKRPIRLFAVACLFHIFTDSIDCWLQQVLP